ncbi:hypothetical protein L3X38_045244 [Prunus dulcis]|uniref:Uncharacterized protein n=1 Tax=Prunus dulcis TaxID=3755 RepID=A0AAD4V0I1_PRUDU|nr:hypothetical protein L3X38_045244 [Prunus dulcis]
MSLIYSEGSDHRDNAIIRVSRPSLCFTSLIFSDLLSLAFGTLRARGLRFYHLRDQAPFKIRRSLRSRSSSDGAKTTNESASRFDDERIGEQIRRRTNRRADSTTNESAIRFDDERIRQQILRLLHLRIRVKVWDSVDEEDEE